MSASIPPIDSNSHDSDEQSKPKTVSSIAAASDGAALANAWAQWSVEARAFQAVSVRTLEMKENISEMIKKHKDMGKEYRKMDNKIAEKVREFGKQVEMLNKMDGKLEEKGNRLRGQTAAPNAAQQQPHTNTTGVEKHEPENASGQKCLDEDATESFLSPEAREAFRTFDRLMEEVTQEGAVPNSSELKIMYESLNKVMDETGAAFLDMN